MTDTRDSGKCRQQYSLEIVENNFELRDAALMWSWMTSCCSCQSSKLGMPWRPLMGMQMATSLQR